MVDEMHRKRDNEGDATISRLKMTGAPMRRVSS
jgi:hypothetical protein